MKQHKIFLPNLYQHELVVILQHVPFSLGVVTPFLAYTLLAFSPHFLCSQTLGVVCCVLSPDAQSQIYKELDIIIKFKYLCLCLNVENCAEQCTKINLRQIRILCPFFDIVFQSTCNLFSQFGTSYLITRQQFVESLYNLIPRRIMQVIWLKGHLSKYQGILFNFSYVFSMLLFITCTWFVKACME